MKDVLYNVCTGEMRHAGFNGYFFGKGVHVSYKPLHGNIHLCSVEPDYSCKKNASDEDREDMKEWWEQVLTHLTVGKQNIENLFPGGMGTSVVKCGNLFADAWLKALSDVNPELAKLLHLFGHTLFPTGMVCIDAETAQAHTEADHTYTMIHVPPQEGLKYGEESGTTFHFYFNGADDSKCTLKIPMCVGTSIYFSPCFLQHRQERGASAKRLINIGGYGSKKLYEFIRATLIRNVYFVGEGVEIEFSGKKIKFVRSEMDDIKHIDYDESIIEQVETEELFIL